MMFKYCKRKNSRKVVITLLPILEFPYPTIIDCYGALHILNGSSTELFTIVIGTKDETKFSVGDVKLFKLNMNNKVWGEMDDLKETIISVELSTDSTPLFATHAIVSSESEGLENDHADSKQEKDMDDDIIVRSISGNEDESPLINIPLQVLEIVMEFCVGVEYLKFRSTCKLCHLAAPLIQCKNGKA
ncbi:hypothetical protein Tco_1350931, partial [Tanacetum coccineum]